MKKRGHPEIIRPGKWKKKFLLTMKLTLCFMLCLQFNLWSERVADAKRLDFMTFPRLIAVAESAWTPIHAKDCSLFMQKLPYYLQLLDAKGIYYFNPFNPDATPEPDSPDKDDPLKNG